MTKRVKQDDKLDFICTRAYEELLKNGIHAFSLNKFIDSLTMSKGQFYYYFRTKEELICKSIDQKYYEVFAYTYEQTKLKSTFVEKMATFFAFFIGDLESQFSDLNKLLKETFHLYLNANQGSIRTLNTEFYRILFGYMEAIVDELIVENKIKKEAKLLTRSFIATVDGMYIHSLIMQDYNVKQSFLEYLMAIDTLLRKNNGENSHD